MLPSFDVLTAIFESHPGARHAERVSGMTTAQYVGSLIETMNQAPSKQARDAIFSHALAGAGVFTTGMEAFHKETEAFIQRTSNHGRLDEEIKRISEESRQSPQYVDPDRIRTSVGTAHTADLTQKLTAKMRSSDHRAAEYDKPAVAQHHLARASANDDADRRAALHAAIAGSKRDAGVLRLPEDPDRSLRESLEDATLVHDYIADQEDPLADADLRSSTNAV
jgi:hypothetical protein